MSMFASLSLISFLLFHVFQAYRAYPLLPLSLGLIALGILNGVIGLIIVLIGYAFGSVATTLGVVSINLGVILNDYASQQGPNWDMHAIHIGVSVFVAGLVILGTTPG